MIKYKLYTLLLLLISIFQISISNCQTNGDFTYKDIDLSISPKFPAICNLSTGIKVRCEQEFLSYKWVETQGTTEIVLKEGSFEQGAHEVLITSIGDEFKLIVTYEAHCTKELKFKVKDLTDPLQIKQYFENAGFWAIPIYRNAPPVACRNCVCAELLEDVSFSTGSEKINLLETNFENFSQFKPLENFSYEKIISNNDCLCDDGNLNFLDFENDFYDSELGLWGHQYFENNTTNEGLLFVKATMPWQENSPKDIDQQNVMAEVLGQSVTTSEQARIIATGLYMTHENVNEAEEAVAGTPCGTFVKDFSDRNLFLESGMVVKLNENYSSPRFTSSKMTSGCFEGSLYRFTHGDKVWNSYYRRETNKNIFVGFFNREKGEYFKEFQGNPLVDEAWMPYLRVLNYFNNPNPNSICKVITETGEADVINVSQSTNGDIGNTIKINFDEVVNQVAFAKRGVKSFCPDPLPTGLSEGWNTNEYQFYFQNGYTIYKIPKALPQSGARFVACITEDDASLTFYEWINGCWIIINEPTSGTVINYEDINLISSAVHVLLDFVGVIPILGAPADLLNASIYAFEGNYTDAAFSMTGIVFEGAVFVKYTAGAYAGTVALTQVGKLSVGILGLIKVGGKFKKIPLADIGKHLDDVIAQLPVGAGDLKKFSDDLKDVFKTNTQFLDEIADNPSLVRGWAALHSSADPLVKAMSTNIDQLKVFDDILKKDVDNFKFADLVGILHPKLANGTPKVWDDITAVLPATKRLVNAKIPGAKMGHKKFPEAANGNAGGALVPAKIYQKYASGDANLSFIVNGVSFDNVTDAGELIDRKFGYANSIFERIGDEFVEVNVIVHNETRIKSILKQASDQIKAANGKQIVWEVPFPLAKEGIDNVFAGQFPDLLKDFKNIDFSVIRLDIKPL